MPDFKKGLRNSVEFIKKIDREYIKEKYTKLRGLTLKDIKNFIGKNKKLVLYAALAVIGVLIFIPIATYIYFVRDLATKETIVNNKNDGVILLDRQGEPFFTLYNANTKTPISLNTLPEYTPQAFIAIEDKNFYNHPGFSLEGIGRAIRENILSESFAQGGSTISQQLIKTTILSPDKKLLRKYQELVLAIELERRYPKDDILEMYLNTVYFGEGVFGIEKASHRYFSKNSSELTLPESAFLAAIINAPSALSPFTGDLNAALRRKDLVLQLMQEQGYITKEEKENAQNTEISFNPTESNINNQAVHFALMVKEKLIKEFGEQEVAQSGFIVKTTLDFDLQVAAQQAVATQIQRLQGSGASNGAAVAIDPQTGQVLALVGSHDWSDEENGKINMAIRPRQPGSSFKPIIYAKALEEKLITPATQINDEPVSFGNYTPRNYDHTFRGEVSARYALANSLNIPAVKVMNMVGVQNGIEFAEKLGITTLSHNANYGLPLVLGAAEVPLIEMTNAYATFANEGKWNEYTIMTEIKDKNGHIIKEIKHDTKRALSQSVAFLIYSMLSDNEARADTFGNSLTISRKTAVKTGTTEDYRDALTIGYTPRITVGAWVGNNDNSPMNSVAGSLGAAPIWRQIMESYLSGKSIINYQVPSGVTDEKICFEKGLKVEFATSSAYTEYFLRGTAPTESCDLATPTPTPDDGDRDNDENEEDNDPTSTPEENPTPTNTPTSVPTIFITPTPVTETTIPSPTLSPGNGEEE